MEEKQKKEEKDNKYLKIILLVIIALIIIVTIVVINIRNIVKIDKNQIQAQIKQEQQEITGQTGKEVSMINMENTENAKVIEGKKENISEVLLKEKDFDGFKIKEIKLYSDDGSTYFKVTVVNNSGKELKAKPITVKFLNKVGENYSELPAYIGDIPAGETGYINASTTEDLVNAYDFIINFN